MSEPIPIIPTKQSSSSSSSPSQSILSSDSYDMIEPSYEGPWLSETQWTVYEKFSRITRFYRQAATAVLESPMSQRVRDYYTPTSRNHAASVLNEYEPARRYAHDFHVQTTMTTTHSLQSFSSSPVPSVPHFQDPYQLNATLVGRLNDQYLKSRSAKKRDFDKKSGLWDEMGEAETGVGTFQVLSNQWTPPLADIERTPMLTVQEWSLFFDKYSDSESEEELDTEDNMEQDSSDVDLTDGRLLINQVDIRDRIFRGGVEPALRRTVWKYLLGIYPWHSTRSERRMIRTEMKMKYAELRNKCLFMQEKMNKMEKHVKNENVPLDTETEHFMDAYCRIERDVIRTDRDHPFYAMVQPNLETLTSQLSLSADIQPGIRNVGKLEHVLQAYSIWPENDNNYVQGMADLASPFLIVMNGNEAEAFFCFVGMMKMMSSNFRRDGAGMHRHLTTLARLLRHLFPRIYTHLDTIDGLNLFCAFRWILVLFKRELSTEHCLRLWEVVWAKGGVDMEERKDALPLSKEWEFVYFVVMAVFEACQEELIQRCAGFDDLLRYSNDISDKLSIDLLLERAEALRLRFKIKSSSALGRDAEAQDCLYDVLDKMESL